MRMSALISKACGTCQGHSKPEGTDRLHFPYSSKLSTNIPFLRFKDQTVSCKGSSRESMTSVCVYL